MSRGVVLWPDVATSARIRDIWNALEAGGVPSLASHTHRKHQPHLSLAVAEALPAEDALVAIGATPTTPIDLRIESVGLFPGNALFLAVVVNGPLLLEQQRVHAAVKRLAVDPWPYFEPGGWVPHITLSMCVPGEELALVIPTVLEHLALVGTLDRGGVEDGTTGENWPATSAS
jgi:hypothetical protein